MCEEPSRDADRLLESKKGMGTACEACTPWDALPAWRGASRLSAWDVPVRGFGWFA